VYPPPPPDDRDERPFEDDRRREDDYGRRHHGDDYGDNPFRRQDLSGMDAFFRNTHMVLLVILSVCCSLVGLILGVIGLATCKNPEARQRATAVTIISGIIFVLGAIARSAQIAQLAK
jgi:hypothetical protein